MNGRRKFSAGLLQFEEPFDSRAMPDWMTAMHPLEFSMVNANNAIMGTPAR